MSKFVKAERKRVKIKIAITGPSGSGKTYSALELASGIGQRIALIDTENDSASLYSDRFTFDTLCIDPPYTIQKYVEAIKAAEAEKYDVVVIDSISHAWAGEGGLLAKKEALDSRGGTQNQYTNWGSITKEHEAFKATLLNADIHMICTMRSKQDYQQIEENGRKKIQKVGMAPIQRDGMEYEFTTVFDVAMDHAAVPSKDRTGLFDGFIAKLTKETGERLIAWLGGATAEPRKAAEPEPENIPSFPAPKPALSAVSPADPGEFVIVAIKEYKGMKVKDVPTHDLAKLHLWAKGLTDPKPHIVDMRNALEAYLNETVMPAHSGGGK